MSSGVDTTNTPIERYAEIAAHIRHAHEDRADVLRRFQMTRQQWERVERNWTGAIEADLDAGGSQLVLAYSEAFERALVSLAPPADLAPVQGSAPQPPSHQDLPPEPFVRTVAPIPPMIVSPPAPVIEDSPLSVSVDETATIDHALVQRALQAGSLPFAGAAVAPATNLALEEAPHPDVGETSFMTALTFDDDPLPFAFDSSAPHVRDPADALPEASEAGADLDRTAFMDAVVLDDDPLPFAESMQDVAPPPPVRATSPHPQAGATRRHEVETSPISPAMPFRPVSAAGVVTIGHLTLQQFAALQVEIAYGVGRIPEVLAAYQVDRTSYLAMCQERDRWCADPELKRSYDEERDAYARWRERR